MTAAVVPFKGGQPESRQAAPPTPNWRDLKPTGSYAQDCRAGEDFAIAVLHYAAVTGENYIFSDLCNRMAESPDVEAELGLRIGYNALLGEVLTAVLKRGLVVPGKLERFVMQRREEYDREMELREEHRRRARSEQARKAANARWAKAKK